jgi:hypothetical protein
MPNFVYFHTDTFHRIGATFADRGLNPETLRRFRLEDLLRNITA